VNRSMYTKVLEKSTYVAPNEYFGGCLAMPVVSNVDNRDTAECLLAVIEITSERNT